MSQRTVPLAMVRPLRTVSVVTLAMLLASATATTARPTTTMWPAERSGPPADRLQAVPAPVDASATVTYFIADGRGKSGYRTGDQELARWAFGAWQRASGDVFKFQPAPTKDAATIQLNWAEPDEGQYGEMQSIVVNGRLGAAVYIRPDMDGLGPEISRLTSRDPLLRDSIVYLTCVHELGHALGLAHTRDYRDIMYFFGYGGDIQNYFGRYRAELKSRNDIAKVSGLSDGDVTRLKRLYGL